MIWCSRCLMPDTRPRVKFTDRICNACLYRDEYEHTDWTARQLAFRELIDAHRDRGPYDCVVPFSGGKDSASIAWRLKHDYGLRPLLATYGQLLWTGVGRRNLERVCAAGFDIFYWRTDQAVSRKLARRFLIERGHPKQHYDSAVNAVPLITAKKFGIPLVVYAEHGESFYGGHVLSEEHRRRRDLAEVLENQVGDDARNWATDGLTERDLYPYIYPDDVSGIEAVYWSWYHKWDIYENAKLAKEKMGFEQARNYWSFERLAAGFAKEWWRSENPGPSDIISSEKWWGKSDGSFEGFDSIDDKIDDLDYYMMHIKFGFGRASRMASRLIQCGHLTREQGLELVRRYDGEYPRSYMKDVLDYVGMSEKELAELIDEHRNPEIWEQKDGTWQLRNPPA